MRIQSVMKVLALVVIIIGIISLLFGLSSWLGLVLDEYYYPEYEGHIAIAWASFTVFCPLLLCVIAAFLYGFSELIEHVESIRYYFYDKKKSDLSIDNHNTD